MKGSRLCRSRVTPRPPTKRKCRECVAAGLPDCKHCICPGCNWCLFRQEAGRRSTPDPARDAPALATLALLAQNGKGAQTVESAPCGALRESGGSVRCRSCRRHNVKKRKADAAIAARLGAAGEAPVNPSPTARHITGGSQQGAYFPSGPVWKSTSELGYTSRRWRGAPAIEFHTGRASTSSRRSARRRRASWARASGPRRRRSRASPPAPASARPSRRRYRTSRRPRKPRPPRPPD